jgi:hypothetical protein
VVGPSRVPPLSPELAERVDGGTGNFAGEIRAASVCYGRGVALRTIIIQTSAAVASAVLGLGSD